MSYFALLGLFAVIGLLNLAAGFLQWLATPYGLISGFIVINLVLCAFTSVCPAATLVRGVCTKAGCLSR